MLGEIVALDSGAPTLVLQSGCGYYEHVVRVDKVCIHRWPGRSKCRYSRMVPVTQPEAAISRDVVATNAFIEPENPKSGTDPGPLLSVATNWTPRDNPKNCDKFVALGNDTGARQIDDLKASPAAVNWKAHFEKFISEQVPTINNHRRILFALYQLLTSTQKAEHLLRSALQP